MPPVTSATLFQGDDAIVRDDLDALPGRIGRSSLLWLDVDRTPSELATVGERFGIEPDTLSDLQSGDGDPGLDDREAYTHVRAQVPERRSAAAEPARIDCLVGERWVITVHDDPLDVLDAFRERASGSGSTGRLDGPLFLATLLEWILGEYMAAFEDVEADLEEIDVRALEGNVVDPEGEVRRLVGLRRDVGALHRALTAHREPIHALTHPELDALSTDESARRFGVLVDRLENAVQAGRDARMAIVASFDVVMARTEHRTNEILKVLTLASVLFLPGSLVAGFLGMNFRVGFFEQGNLFWVVVAAVLGMIVATAFAARRRGWV